MPAYKTPQRFPGVQRLPALARILVERTFPPDQLPTPMAGVTGKLPFPNKAGGAIPDGISLSSLFGTLKTNIPEAPPTAQRIDQAFDLYREMLKRVLQQGPRAK